MKALEWSRLTDITKTVKPYRGTTNRFPIMDRRHNHKDFISEERNGEQVYVVRYGFSWKSYEHTKEEYLANPSTIHERNNNGVITYESYKTVPRELGIVRSDNTFEFTNGYYGQGDNMILSNWSRGYFSRSSRHGGMIYSERGSIFHPIFKGMRVNCETMMPHEDSKYQVIGKRVSRKDAKEFLTRYADFYQVNEVMLKTMEWKGYMETAVEVMAENGIGTDNWSLHSEDRDKLIKFADENLNTAPLDAGIAFTLAYDVQNMFSRVRAFNGNGNSYYTREVELEVVFANLKRKLNKELYKRNPSVMKLTEYVPNEVYPPSEWGVEITVNGKEVEQL